MPYKRIHWIKLEKRLLNDYRFYTLSSEAQLIYLKLLMLAAETTNKIPKNHAIIKTALRSNFSENKIKESIKEIKTKFPKFKEKQEFYCFSEWGSRCNWVTTKERLGSSRGVPKETLDKTILDKIRLHYTNLKCWDESSFLPADYGRMHKAIKVLVTKAKGLDEEVVLALDWISSTYNGKGLDWTLETLSKKWPDFLKVREKLIVERKLGAEDG